MVSINLNALVNLKIIILITLALTCLVSCIHKNLIFKNKEAEKHFEKGLIAENKKDTKTALLYYAKADSIEPNNAAIIHTIGMLQSHSGNFRLGLANINRSIKLETDSITKKMYYSNRGNEYYENSMLDSACADWKIAGKYDGRSYKRYCEK